LFNSKLDGRKLGFNTSLSALPKDTTSELATQQANYLHTNPFLCQTSSREAV